MIPAIAAPAPTWPRARKLRLAARATLVLWGLAVAAFIVLAGIRIGEELLSALGVIASALFATGFLLQSLANRAEWRAIAAVTAQENSLLSSTTRKR
jgi:hypothetical protein